MQSYIEGLAKGIFSYDVPRIVINESKLELAMGKDEVLKGSFGIKVCDDRKAEGFVYSSSHRMTCLTPQFRGTEAEIQFEYNSFGLPEGTGHQGRFYIVSDAGEYEIPYEVLIAKDVTGGRNEVSSLQEFATLAGEDWYAAYEIFGSEKFQKVLSEESESAYACFRALCGNGITMQCMEEFLVGIKAKEQIEFEIEENGEEFKSLTDTFKHSVKIKKSNWGYIRLIAEADADFITLQKNVVSTEDFIGSSCNIDFYINYSKLHPGINFGRIYVRSPYETQEYLFRVIMPSGGKNPSIAGLEHRQDVLDITEIFVEYTLGIHSKADWIRDSLPIINRMTGFDPRNNLYSLYKAMILYADGRMDDASIITDSFRADNNVDDDPVMWAFYLYVMTFAESEDYILARIRNELNDIFDRRIESNILTWIKLNVDEVLVNNSIDKYRVIKDSFAKGCNSPVLYAEAALALNDNPLLVCAPEDAEVAFLQWMKRRECIGRELGEQFLDQLAAFKRYDHTVFKVAEYICETYDTENNVRLLCSYLIRMDKSEAEYNKWYQKGIEYDLKITRLYEYYIISVNEDLKDPLPKVIYMYFRYNSNIDNRKKAFLYANLIENKDIYPEIFKSYQKNIEQFMNDQFFKGVINENMAVIYNEFFYSQMIMEDMEDQFVDLMSAYRLEVSDESLTKVTVIYHKLNNENTYAITDGKALIHLYSEDYIMIFGDAVTGYMSDVDYSVTPYVSFREFMRKALRLYKNNEKLIISYLEHPDRVSIPKNEMLDLKHTVLMSDNVKESYKVLIRSELIDYFHNNDSEYMEEVLTEIPLKNLPPEKKIKLAEVLMYHRYYEHAYKLIRSFGYESVSTDNLLKLATFIIEKYNFEPRDFLTDLCYEVYERGMYNEQTLKYLAANYYSNTANVSKLAITCEDFGIDCFGLWERIIKQVLYTGTYFSDVDRIYDNYFKSGATETLKNAYLQYYAYAYLIHNKVISASVFEYICKELTVGERVHDVCKLALLKHFAEEKHIDPKYRDLARDLLESYYFRDINLNCFNKVADLLSIRLGTGSRQAIEYITNPDHKVEIHYMFNTDDYVDEEMYNVFEGIFVKEIAMFFGENIQYYITETDGETEQVVESGEIKKTELNVEGGESRYDVINDILFSISVNDDTTTIDLMKQYDRLRVMSEQLFTIM